MAKKMWVLNRDSGIKKIGEAAKERVKERILKHAQKNHAGKYLRLDVRFRGAFCYIDAFTEPYVSDNFNADQYQMTREEYTEALRNEPTHLVRLDYRGSDDSWGMAFYTYSHEKYEVCFFSNGTPYGTPEEALDIGALYLG